VPHVSAICYVRFQELQSSETNRAMVQVTTAVVTNNQECAFWRLHLVSDTTSSKPLRHRTGLSTSACDGFDICVTTSNKARQLGAVFHGSDRHEHGRRWSQDEQPRRLWPNDATLNRGSCGFVLEGGCQFSGIMPILSQRLRRHEHFDSNTPQTLWRGLINPPYLLVYYRFNRSSNSHPCQAPARARASF
jgi:hypothetical protein